MARITQIKPQKFSRRFNIYLDGKFGFGLNSLNLAKTGLKVGQDLSEKEIRDLVFESEFQKLFDKALHFLSFRPRSEKEIRDYLEKKVSNFGIRISDFRKSRSDLKDKLVGKVVKSLKRRKLLDDSAFAEWWCQQRNKFRPRSKRMLMVELWRKGVEKSLAEKTVSEMINEEDLIRQLISKKKRLYSKLSFKEQKRKLSEYFLRRGFNFSEIKKVIDSCLKKG